MKFFYNRACPQEACTLPFITTKMIALSEQQILELQDIFLNSGLHYIFVPSMQEGRRLIYTFLKAIRIYKMIGCITTHKSPLKKDYFDIYHYLKSYGYLDAVNEFQLNRFFLEEFEFDLVWIEKESESDFGYLEEQIRLHQIYKQLPILILIVR